MNFAPGTVRFSCSKTSTDDAEMKQSWQCTLAYPKRPRWQWWVESLKDITTRRCVMYQQTVEAIECRHLLQSVHHRHSSQWERKSRETTAPTTQKTQQKIRPTKMPLHKNANYTTKCRGVHPLVPGESWRNLSSPFRLLSLLPSPFLLEVRGITVGKFWN